MDSLNDGKVWSRCNAPKQELIAFLLDCQERGLSEPTQTLFRKLAAYRCDLRLAVNLKAMLGQHVLHVVDDVLHDALCEEEKSALNEVDSSGMPIQLREIAHGLLNLHERWLAMKALAKMFRQARAARDNYEDERLLVDLLNVKGGDPEDPSNR